MYESLVKEFKDSLYKADAEERIAVLRNPEGRNFYAWFASFERPKAAEKHPHDKTDDDLNDDLLQQLHKSETNKSGTEETESPTIPPSEKSSADEPSDGDLNAPPKSDDAQPPADDPQPDES